MDYDKLAECKECGTLNNRLVNGGRCYKCGGETQV